MKAGDTRHGVALAVFTAINRGGSDQGAGLCCKNGKQDKATLVRLTHPT
jgi:hypothetical protein